MLLLFLCDTISSRQRNRVKIDGLSYCSMCPACFNLYCHVTRVAILSAKYVADIHMIH